MPKRMTPKDRANTVARAATSLPALVGAAIAADAAHGEGSPDARRAWEAVEMAGATVHRQARLLAGKSRGG